ncbi:apolipoprotein N-acyltransferase [Sediminispirochaeta smaragdinae]|nr:apolipoprotein N-acyltransferase [Sediminispirochaeta smaragdinae]
MRRRSAFGWSFEQWFPAFAIVGLAVPLTHLIKGPVGMASGGGLGEDIALALLLSLHFLWLLSTKMGKTRGRLGTGIRLRRLSVGSELLLVPSLLFLLFSLIFAANANMSYAQWFAETKGNLRLAPDSSLQRLNSLIRYLPLVVLDGVGYVAARIGRRGRLSAEGSSGLDLFLRRWSTLLALASAVLVSLSFSTPLAVKGIGWIGYIAPIPLLLVLSYTSPVRALFAGVSYGTLQALLGNYWLGTYDLLSLHFVTDFHIVIYCLYIPLLLLLSRAVPGPLGRRLRLPLMALIWVAFDFIRSGGFLGYPWGILGTSQYRYPVVIQIASLFGVWGVNLFLWLFAAFVASLIEGIAQGGGAGGWNSVRRCEALLLVAMTLSVMVYGLVALKAWEAREAKSEITVALIQQNTDPRKNDYASTLDVLESLTRAALSSPTSSLSDTLPDDVVALKRSGKPVDLVAWSETAFVPNLRKWGAMDPSSHPNAALANRLLHFQRQLGTWLLTGNDDYDEVTGDDGGNIRNHYNASVFFSDTGERIATYRKMHMVPFSEYFPYEKQFPLFYKILTDFDATLWEAGSNSVIFSHPRADFITPICFEDSFPGEVAAHVLPGVDMILNISNDFWSRTETEGQQHAANALFRAVENRRPLLRSTASGLTCIISPVGKISVELPHYHPGYIVADVPLYGRPETFYQRHIDLLPRLILLFLPLFLVSGLIVRLYRLIRYRCR